MKLPLRSALTLSVVVVFYAVGVFGHVFAPLKQVMLTMTPWFLWTAGLAVLVSFFWGKDAWRGVLSLLPLLLLAFGVEVLGVATGWVFGRYRYGKVLGTLVAGVPPVIGWNWVLVVTGIHTAVRGGFPQIPRFFRIGLVGLACVAFDFVMEPVAVNLGYWTWLDGSIPLQNYLAWGVIAMAGAWWAERKGRWPNDPIVAGAVLCQALFFAFLGLAGVRS